MNKYLCCHLKPKHYPDFMGKADSLSYKSTKILGRLFRHIKDASDEEDTSSSQLTAEKIPYDPHLEILGSADFISDALDSKCSYDRQLEGLLKQYKVSQEEEIVTGHLSSMPKFNSRKQWDLKEKVRHAYSSLKKEFRQKFEYLGPEFNQIQGDERHIIYERKASAWYQVTYHPDHLERLNMAMDPEEDAAHKFMLSFAWIPADYLARIKLRSHGKRFGEDTYIQAN